MPAPEQYPFALQPLAHQLAEFIPNWGVRYRAIFWDQGTGKTKLAIDTAGQLYRNGDIDAVVVLAPNGVHRNWATDEIPKHLPPRALELSQVVFYQAPKSSTKWHERQLERLLAHKGLSWLMITYDAILTDRCKDFLWKFLKARRVLFIADEAHNMKAVGAKRTKRILAASRYAPFRRILTGTPISQGPFDIYSQMKFLDEDFWKQRGFDSYQVFKHHYGVWFTAADCQSLHGYDPGYDKLMGYKNLDELQDILAPHSTRVLKEDVLDLPPKVFSKRYYELTPEQVRLYNGLKEEFYVELEQGIVEAPLAIVRMLRFQQIICGYVPVEVMSEDGAVSVEYVLLDKNPRIDAFEAWAEPLYKKTIVWARFTKDIDLIVEKLSSMGGKVVRYDGTQGDDANADASEQFKRGDAQWIVGNPQKGKEGLTWNMAHHVAYYSNSFRLLDRLQSEDRAHRIGLQHPVDYTDFEAQIVDGERVTQTIDQHIIKNLRNKVDIARQITGDQLREWI